MRIRSFLHRLERLSLALETPIVRWVRDPRFNPLYHTGPITVFLLLVIGVSGLYLTLFYSFGFQASYQAVASIEANPVGRVMRAIHRYASGAGMIAALLHAWRTFIQDRFRGPRSLAWLTGVGLAGLLWLIGVTGYWLIWDERAALITQTLMDGLAGAAWGQTFLVNQLLLPADRDGWIFVLLVISLHLGLSLAVGGLLWLHLKRLSRPKWLPPNFWMGALGGLLLAAALLFPAGMLPAANPSLPASLPASLPLDVFYLFHLPAALSERSAAWWAAFGGLLALALAVPWLLGPLARRPVRPVLLDEAACTGCTLCAADCPYRALRMVERQDGRRHKYVAQLDPGLCVACGICIGSCAPGALRLPADPAQPAALDWRAALAAAAQAGRPRRAVFICQRFDPLPVLPRSANQGQPEPLVIPLPCIGGLHPDWISQALACGACGVDVIGCPPEDCLNREGNRWMQERLARQRLPRLRLPAVGQVRAGWLSPLDLRRALGRLEAADRPATAYTFQLTRRSWPKLLPALALLAAVLGGQLLLSAWPFRPYPSGQAQVEIVLRHRSGYPIQGAAQPASPPDPVALLATPPAQARLVLWVDDLRQAEWQAQVGGAGRRRSAYLYVRLPLAAGEHHLRLELYDPVDAAVPQVLYDGPLALSERQAVRLVYTDQVVGGDPQAGEALFSDRSPGQTVSCRICHSLEPDVTLVGPSLAGMGRRAAQRVPGLSAEAYLRQSILDPDAFIVPGFPAGQMPKTFAQSLADQQVADLVSYLLTLR